jgi:hypothetical protein
LEKHDKELKAKLAELEAGYKTKKKGTVATPKSKMNSAEVKRPATCQELRVFAPDSADVWDRAAVRK